MGQMLHQLKSSLAEFAESDEVAAILMQMLQVRARARMRTRLRARLDKCFFPSEPR